MSVTTFDHIRKQGDTADPLEVTLTNTNAAGETVDYAIPGSADVFLTITEWGGDVVILDGGAMTPDADQTANPGLVTYAWEAADVAEAGNFQFEIKVVLADATEIRFPRERDAPYGTLLIMPNLG